MTRTRLLSRGAGVIALAALTAAPAFAFPGKGDRAQVAIAEAKGKIEAANHVNASGEVPGLQSRAQAALRAAEEDIAAGHKEQAIDDAHHASELADMAVGQASKNRVEAEAGRRRDAEAAAADAQKSAAAANARADAAQQAAVSANAQADALRNAPPPPAPAPTTTVTVDKEVRSTAAPVHHVTHRVVHRRTTPVHTVAEKTTTTVTTTPN